MKHISLIILMAVLLGSTSCVKQRPATTRLTQSDNPKEVSQIRQLESTAQLIEATKQKMLGNFGTAIRLYAEAVKIDPRNSAALYELAKLNAQQGFMQDAETFARQAVNLDPGNKYFALLLADIYFVQGKNDQGLRVQQNIAAQNPNDINVQISLLSTFLYLEKYAEAIAQIDYLERITGFNNELSLQKQRIFIEMGQQDKALQEALRLVSYFPDEPVYLELVAELYQETSQPEKAYEIYYQMLRVQPDNAMAHLLLADYYRNEGDEEKTFEMLRKAFYSTNLGVEGKVRIMASYFFISESDSLLASQAFMLCDILVEMHPEDAQAHAIYAEFLSRESRYEEAWERFFKAATLDPSELSYWQQLLFTEARMEDYESMLRTSDKALEYFFEQPVIFYFNGIANRQLKNFDRAISAFKMGKDLAINDPELQGQFYTLLGDTYHSSGNYEESYRSYERALTLNPNDAVALNNYSYYMSKRGINLEKALIMSARSLELDPDNAAFQDTYGWIKYMLGDYQTARIWIRKALDNSEVPSTVVLEHYGDVLYKLGEKDDALAYWKRALESRGDDPDDSGSAFLEKKVEQGKLFE